MELFKEVVHHAGSDSLKILPFLFIAFLLIESLEHYAGGLTAKTMAGMGKAGPVVGALAGCLPQCGFSVVAANLYGERFISLGTLLAVFIATSDEAILIILGDPGRIKDVALLLLVKVAIAVIAGYGIDRVFGGGTARLHESHAKVSGCHCNGRLGSIVKTAGIHTVKIFVFLFLFTALIDLAIHLIGEDGLSRLLLNDTFMQPMIAAALGLIPNCVPSVLLTQLYLEGLLSFSSLISGLCTGAGLGLLVLFKANRDKRENIKIVGLLYLVAVLAGFLLAMLQMMV